MRAGFLACWIGIALAACAEVRMPLYCYHFDTTNAVTGIDHVGVNEGTGTADLEIKMGQTYTNWLSAQGSGALGSSNAFNTTLQTSLWLRGDGTRGLGCDTNTGFTVSLWVKPNPSGIAWSDVFGFRFDGSDVRFEYCNYFDADGNKKFTFYSSEGSGYLPTGQFGYFAFPSMDWVHVCFVWNPLTKYIDLYLDGVLTGEVHPGGRTGSGLLEELYIGSTVRQQNGVRAYQHSDSGVDEVAIYGFSVGTDELNWLRTHRPGPIPRGRQRVANFSFDTTNAVFGTLVQNQGTASTKRTLKESVGSVVAYQAPGALGTAAAFHEKDATTFFFTGDAPDGFGCSTNTGFTLGFWIKPLVKPPSWSDPIAFRIGGANIRFEFTGENSSRAYYFYGDCNMAVVAANQRTLPSNEWTQVALVWNQGAKRCDVYQSGSFVTSFTVNNATNGTLEALYFGRGVMNEKDAYRTSNPSGVLLDEIVLYNYSLAAEQVPWLVNNVPLLPPLIETNLVRTVAGSCVWESPDWWPSGTTRHLVWPTGEDTNIAATVTASADATLAVDTPVRGDVSLLAGGGSSLALVRAGGVFAPRTLSIGSGLTATLPAGTAVGSLAVADGAQIAFDLTGWDGVSPVLEIAGTVSLPASDDTLAAHLVAPSGYALAVSADSSRVTLTAGDATPVTATWTGAAADGNLANAANWTCWNAAGAVVANALPTAQTTVSVTGSTTLSVPAGASFACRQVALSGTVTLAADCDWRGLGCVSIPAGVTVDLAGRKLYLASFDGSRNATGVVTDSGTGGELHLALASGASLYNYGVTFTGALKFVKEGTGTYVIGCAGHTYAGGTEIAAGTVALLCSVTTANRLGAAGTVVRIDADAVLDLNGTSSHQNNVFELAGGIVRNSKQLVGATSTYSMLTTVRLTADSGFDFGGSYGLLGSNHGATTLDLAGHRLTVAVGGTNAFHLCNADVSGGTLDVKGGWLECADTSVRAPTLDLDVTAAFNVKVPVTVSNFTTRAASAAKGGGTGVVSVGGTFAPLGATCPNVKLLDGATLDLSTRTLPWSATCAHTQPASTNTFTVAPQARVTVNLAAREDLRDLSRAACPYVVTWDQAAVPTGVTYVADPATAAARFELRGDATGVKLCYLSGTVFIVR